MKYYQKMVVAVPVWPPPDLENERRRRGWRSGVSGQFCRDVAADNRAFHPFLRDMPSQPQELAEEIGARLTALAVRTHVPLRGRPRPLATLRMRHALRVLSRSGGELTVTRLALRLGIGVPASSQLVRRMGRRGLIERCLDRSDRRVVVVTLTRTGWRHVSVGQEFSFPAARYGLSPFPLRRASQPPAALESGLRSDVLNPALLLASLRAVQAAMYGYQYGLWEADFERCCRVRRRYRRCRSDERHVIALLPSPRYTPPKPRGRYWPVSRRFDF